MFLEETIFNNHKLNLINQILTKYFKIRLHHEAKSSQDLVQRVIELSIIEWFYLKTIQLWKVL